MTTDTQISKFTLDNTDELGCEGAESSPIPQVPHSQDCKGPGLFSCDFGQCFPESAMCDGHLDCIDGTDEPANCPSQHHGAKVSLGSLSYSDLILIRRVCGRFIVFAMNFDL